MIDSKRLFIKSKNKNIRSLGVALHETGLPFDEEYRFHPERRFRFDFAIPLYKIAVEYEGGVYGRAGGHRGSSNFAADCEKYNLATAMGWRVLRFTAVDFTKNRVNLRWYIEQIIKNGGL